MSINNIALFKEWLTAPENGSDLMCITPAASRTKLTKYYIQDPLILIIRNKNGVTMARPCKLTPEIQQLIGDNVALGLTYSLATEAAGITYKTFNEWMNRGKTEKSGKYCDFYNFIQKCNADGARILLEKLNDAAKAGNCTVCMWILSRRFSEDFGRRVYKKTNVVSENLNHKIEIVVTDTDKIREENSGEVIDLIFLF